MESAAIVEIRPKVQNLAKERIPLKIGTHQWERLLAEKKTLMPSSTFVKKWTIKGRRCKTFVRKKVIRAKGSTKKLKVILVERKSTANVKERNLARKK